MSDHKNTTLRPLEDRLIVEPVDEKETSASGLIIPETVSKEKPQKGKVLYVGPGRIDNNGNRIDMEVKVGDVVLFSKYGPTEIKVDGKELMVLNQSDVMAILE